MSNFVKKARHGRVRKELGFMLPYEATLNRMLFSSMGALVGTGVVALAFVAPEANAKSALDDMAWLPQQTPLTQGTGSQNTMASAAALARSMVPPVVQAPVTAVSVPAVVERPVASEPLEGNTAPAVQAPLQVASVPQRARGFSDVGLGDPVPPAPVASVVRAEHTAEALKIRKVETPQAIAPAWPIRN